MAKLSPIEAEKLLKGMDYPTNKKDIVKYAQEHGADGNALDVLKKLPEHEYDSPVGISKELGKIDRQQGSS